MHAMTQSELNPAPPLAAGQRIRITQQVPRQLGAMTVTIEGIVTKIYQGKSGSWFAHSKDKRVWLDRLDLRKDDGEQVTCNLDQYTQIELLASA